MKNLLVCAVVLTAFVMPATAGAKYDRQLERAVMDIVAKNIGELRGGFDFNEKPVFIITQDMMTTGSISFGGRSPEARPASRDWDWKYGPALASERTISRIVY